jgi:hypothetical protein
MKKIRILGVLFAAVIAAMAFIGCGDGDKGTGPSSKIDSKLVGTWEGPNGTYKFNADGTGSLDVAGYVTPFTNLTTENNKVLSGGVAIFGYEINGSTLTLTDANTGTAMGQFTKQGGTGGDGGNPTNDNAELVGRWTSADGYWDFSANGSVTAVVNSTPIRNTYRAENGR